MKKLKQDNTGACEWLSKFASHKWSRSHFKVQVKCDILPNMCESFNRSILVQREQGILVMLELIREYMMKRLQDKREKMKQWEHRRFIPKTYKLIENFQRRSGGCYPTNAGEDQFEVTTENGTKFAVDLRNKTCGCRRWDLTGVPCVHVIACINKVGYDVEDYVDECYSTRNYRNAYSGIVHPMNGHPQWEKTCIKLKPPMTECPTETHSKRKRKMEVAEPQKSKEDGVVTLSKINQLTVRCGGCKKIGHNKRTCPQTATASGNKLKKRQKVVTEPSSNDANDVPNVVDVQRKNKACTELMIVDVAPHPSLMPNIVDVQTKNKVCNEVMKVDVLVQAPHIVSANNNAPNLHHHL